MTAIHSEPHPSAGTTVDINIDGIGSGPFRVEDWWDRIVGMSWTVSESNPAAMKYGIRSGRAGLPWDDQVVYGKFGSAGHLLHVSELAA